MPLEHIRNLDTALRDAMDIVRELESTDTVNAEVIGRFHEILSAVDSSLINLRTSNPDNDLNEGRQEGDSSGTTGIFSGASGDIRPIFESIADRREYKMGDVVMKEGEIGDKLYVIESGKVMVYIKSGDTMLVLSTLSSGDFFGEMALVADKPRSATVTAMSELSVYEIKRDDLVKALYEHPEIIRAFARQFEIRIKHMKKYLLK